MRKYFILTAVLASLLSASAASASILGENIYGRIGVSGSSSSVNSSTASSDPIVTNSWGMKTVGKGLEFKSVNDRNVQRANFNGNVLVISDLIRRNANVDGWKMKFRLPPDDAFKTVTLQSSTFTQGLTYFINPKGILVVSFAGDPQLQNMSLAERREAGPQLFSAKFSIVNEAGVDAIAVPESATWAMFAAGLFGLAAFGWSRRNPVLKRIRIA